MKKYILKPLKWVGKISNPDDSIIAQLPFGSYTISSNAPASPEYVWEYNFGSDDYGSYYASSIESCKEMAWEHWQERISTSLIPVV